MVRLGSRKNGEKVDIKISLGDEEVRKQEKWGKDNIKISIGGGEWGERNRTGIGRDK